MHIKSAEFVISNTDYRYCPGGIRQEYAFIGRSNVGKSSLINMLTQHSHLAKTSQMPGKTLLINHFLINNEWFLVDLPGYGYARQSKTQRVQLQRIIEDYILQRPQLTNVFVLIDSRLEPQPIDLEFMEWLGENSVPFAIVFTKCDKDTITVQRRKLEAYRQKLAVTWEPLPPIFQTSATTGIGRDALLDYIERINMQAKRGEECSKL